MIPATWYGSDSITDLQGVLPTNEGSVSSKATAVALWRPIAAGFLVLMVAMGIGRFAYTPILPSMERVARLSATAAGLIATANYAGYLLGAIAAARWPSRVHRLNATYGALLISAGTTAAMGWVSGLAAWAVVRTIGGTVSACAFVWISSIVLDWVAQEGRSDWAGFVYAGVGSGIAMTGVLTPALLLWDGWAGAWRALGAVALILGLLAWRILPTLPVSHRKQLDRTFGVDDDAIALWRLLVAYGLEGCGYIVMGTFDVSLLAHLPGLQRLGMWSWTFVGLAAAPSTWAWSILARRYGVRPTLLGAYGLQAMGVVLPVLWPTAISAILSALLFGGTFMGITTVALSASRASALSSSSAAVGIMTAVFGIGQVVGPGLAGWVAVISHGETIPFLGSGALLLIAVGVLARWRRPIQQVHPCA